MSTREIGACLSTVAAVLLLAMSAAAQGPNLGQPISQADLAPWDLTIMPDGTGLPPGGGTPAQGKVLFADNCALCMAMKARAASSKRSW